MKDNRARRPAPQLFLAASGGIAASACPEFRMTEADLELIERAAGGKTSAGARQVLVRSAMRRDK
jgi:hypothetical protein